MKDRSDGLSSTTSTVGDGALKANLPGGARDPCPRFPPHGDSTSVSDVLPAPLPGKPGSPGKRGPILRASVRQHRGNRYILLPKAKPELQGRAVAGG